MPPVAAIISRQPILSSFAASTRAVLIGSAICLHIVILEGGEPSSPRCRRLDMHLTAHHCLTGQSQSTHVCPQPLSLER